MMFENPYYFFLFTIPIAYIVFKYFIKQTRRITLSPTVLFSSREIFSKKSTWLAKSYHVISDLLITLSMVFFIIALARPLGGQAINTEKNFGIDIMLSIDVSGSMLSVDFIPKDLPYRDVFGGRIYYDQLRTLVPKNRLNSAKRVIKGYVQKQAFNRIGIVVFAGHSLTKCPLTLDKSMLENIIDDIRFDPANDGTAIGMGIASAINRLKKSPSKSKVIILLTDGINNSGMIAPLSAAEIARDMGIRVYTIGLGNPNGFLSPGNLELKEYVFERDEGIDEKVLTQIAEITGGKFYQAYDADSLQNIYDDIDKLEKSRMEIKKRVLYKENFMPFLLSGLIFLALYIVLTSLIQKLP